MRMKILFGAGALIYTLPFLAWWFFLGANGDNPISKNSSEWANFGSFIGGFLSPALSFASIIFLYITIRNTSKNNSSQIKLMQEQVEHMQAQDRRSLLMELCKAYNERLDESIEKSLHPIIKAGHFTKIYDGERDDIFTLTPIPVREAMASFFEKNKPGLTLSKEYFNILSNISVNAEHCYCAILDLLLSVESQKELEALTNLAEAIPNYYATQLLLDFYIAKAKHDINAPILERLCEINNKTKFNLRYVAAYKKLRIEGA